MLFKCQERAVAVAVDYYRITGGRFQAPGLHKEP
jgi:hypothetical protein